MRWLSPPFQTTSYLPRPNPTPPLQAARNLHAMLAVRALAALAGYPGCRPPTPANLEAQRALRALLTETLAPRLAEEDPRPLLRDLNTTVQTPQVG